MNNRGNGRPNRPSNLKRKERRAWAQSVANSKAQVAKESGWPEENIGTCQGCGRYGILGTIHTRRVPIGNVYHYEECGEYL